MFNVREFYILHHTVLYGHETWPELAFTVSSFSLEIEKEEVEVNTSSLAVCRKVQRLNIVNSSM